MSTDDLRAVLVALLSTAVAMVAAGWLVVPMVRGLFIPRDHK